MILVISRDKDFSGALAEQVVRELNLPCREAETIETAKRFMTDAMAIVSDGDIAAPNVPVISLGGRKPVRMRELLAEIKMAAQRTAASTLKLGRQYEFSPQQKHLKHISSGKKTALTDKEVQLLQAMMGAGKRGVAREDLLKQVWGFEADLNTHTLETHVYRLRGKFKDLSGSDAAVEAFDGGYRLAV